MPEQIKTIRENDTIDEMPVSRFMLKDFEETY